MRADPASRTLRLGVTELVGHFTEWGIGFAARGGSRAAWLGAALHARYQAEAALRVPGYRSEVPLARTATLGGWTLELRGRCDGLRPAAQDDDVGWVVEELKTGRRSPSPGSPGAEAFALQARLYAWMASEQLGARIRAEWIWLPAGGGDPSVHTIANDSGALERQLGRLVSRIGDEALREEAVRRERRQRAESVRFPFASRRHGQREIESAVENALETGAHLLLQAPTGLGKTAAVLTPVLRHVLARDRRAFVASASTLQQRGAMETLRAIAPRALPVAARLRAKRRMCATGTLLCHPRQCDHAEDYGRRLRETGASEQLLAAGPLVEPDLVWKQASATRLCPFELSLDTADRVPVTVGDANYIIDPVVALPRWSDPDELEDAVLVIDEAHRLPARAREALSSALSAQSAAEAAHAAALGGAPIHRRQRELAEATAAWIDDEVGDSLGSADGAALREPEPEHALRLLADLDAGVDETLAALDGAAAEGPHAAFLDLAWLAFRWRAEPLGSHARVAVRENGDARLERWCLDPAPALQRVFGAAASVITMSATLSPTDLYADLLGLDPDRVATTTVPGRAPGERQRVVIEPRVSTRYADRGEDEPRIAASLSALLDEVPGNALILTSSFAALDRLQVRLAPARHGLRAQRPDDGEPERSRLLDELQTSSSLAVLAIAGGALAEGVDTAGLGLRLVAVVGPCLPRLDPKNQLLVEHYEEQRGAGFEMAVALPGMTRVIQSAGRLLRRDDDFGLIVLYGGRFLRTPYRDWLPESWLGGGEPEDLVADPVEAARQFFAARSGAGRT